MTLITSQRHHTLDASLLSDLLDMIRLENSASSDVHADSSETLRVLRENNPELRMRLVRHIDLSTGRHRVHYSSPMRTDA